jgi:short-subunit dehydrogenase
MPTALITGASAGLGAEFARQLAVAGHDLVLVARNRGRLELLADLLYNQHEVDVQVLIADLATPQGRTIVARRLDDPGNPVDVLINNAGAGLGQPVTATTTDAELALLDLNCAAVLHLTHTALRRMLERDQGKILNVSSVAAMGPAWTANGYGATKAYVLALTRDLALSHAVDASKVTMCCLCPGDIATQFNQSAGIDNSLTPGWRWVSARHTVARALRDLDRAKTISVPTLRYRILAGLLHHLPPRITRRFALDFSALPASTDQADPAA